MKDATGKLLRQLQMLLLPAGLGLPRGLCISPVVERTAYGWNKMQSY